MPGRPDGSRNHSYSVFKLNLLQKVQNSKRKAVNISGSNTSGISFDCNASEGVRNPLSACRFTQIGRVHITVDV